jgi:hypothetical protein
MERRRLYPGRDDPRCAGDLWLPVTRPRFSVPHRARVFTIGSCFARHIEDTLVQAGTNVLTYGYSVPKSEWPYRPNGILNEYNPASIAQRIQWAVERQPAPASTICPCDDRVVDLLLPVRIPVTDRRAVERRAEIDALWATLRTADLVIVTLGLIEIWVDRQTGVTLNGKPPAEVMKQHEGRFVWRRMDPVECVTVLSRAIVALLEQAPATHVLLTVSPVPLSATYSEQDAILATFYSKAVLRVCAEMLIEQLPQVDYFPVAEMIATAGRSAFHADNVHVQDWAIRQVTERMLALYFR